MYIEIDQRIADRRAKNVLCLIVRRPHTAELKTLYYWTAGCGRGCCPYHHGARSSSPNRQAAYDMPWSAIAALSDRVEVIVPELPDVEHFKRVLVKNGLDSDHQERRRERRTHPG